jgi:Ala-tRNA(Pro) deacylase
MSICDYLRGRSIPFERLLHRPAPSATRRAHFVHVSGRLVAKSVLLRTECGYVLAVLPATHRLDLGRVEEILGRGPLRLATEDELERVFHDCERGALPPFGHLYGLTTLVDVNLVGAGEIIVEGNTRHEGLRLRYRDYEALTSPIYARFATACSPPRRRRESHRRAG